MRVIAGTARSLRLETIDTMDTRPTTDRIKETLFNIISRELPDCTFLDLFSGSGAIAIEALSRGAKQAVLVEQNRKAVDCINRNLEFTKLKDKAQETVLQRSTVWNGQDLCLILYLWIRHMENYWKNRC